MRVADAPCGSHADLDGFRRIFLHVAGRSIGVSRGYIAWLTLVAGAPCYLTQIGTNLEGYFFMSLVAPWGLTQIGTNLEGLGFAVADAPCYLTQIGKDLEEIIFLDT